MKNVIIFAAIVIFILTVIGFCQQALSQDVVNMIIGEVGSVDWVGNKIAVKTFYNGNYDEMLFYVSKDTGIVKSDNKISLADINLSDKVTVNYSGSFAGLKALQITVK